MKKIAITGTMGSGKTEVSNILRKKGYVVFSCDEAVHNMYQEGHPLYPKLLEIAGVKENLKQQVADKFFIDQKFKESIEQEIYKELLKEMDEFFAKDQSYHFVEVPLLYELKWESYFDQVIVVTCEDEIALNRLIHNRGVSEEVVRQRWKYQMSKKDKIERADEILYNNGTVEQLQLEVENLLKKWEEIEG